MSDATPMTDMIAALAADLKPVKRLRSPGIRAAVWLGCVAVLALVLAYFADLGALQHRLMAVPDMGLAVLGSVLTAVLATVAAFELSVPGRHSWWALVPLPPLALWIGASGMGCLRTWIIPGTHDALWDETKVCFTFIVATSLPLSLLMVLMIRRACPLRPNLTAAVCGLAIAACAASLLNFFHPYDASASDLAVHFVAVAVVVGLNQVFGRRALPVRRVGAFGFRPSRGGIPPRVEATGGAVIPVGPPGRDSIHD